MAVRRKRGPGGARHQLLSPGRVLIAVMALLALPLIGCGGSATGSSSSQAGVSGSQSASSSVKYAGVAASPSKPAPPLALRDSLGHPVNLDQYRGKAVLVTFIYDHCPDVCPLIVGHMHTAQAQLGPVADKLQIVAVSVDPRGDTARTVKAFLREHRMTGRMEYLIGSRPELEKVWRDWSILSKGTPTPKDPDLVEHSALVYGISGSGRITTLYSQDFAPAQIAHDVPILASQ
jgi:protein SCO1/2